MSSGPSPFPEHRLQVDRPLLATARSPWLLPPFLPLPVLIPSPVYKGKSALFGSVRQNHLFPADLPEAAPAASDTGYLTSRMSNPKADILNSFTQLLKLQF